MVVVDVLIALVVLAGVFAVAGVARAGLRLRRRARLRLALRRRHLRLLLRVSRGASPRAALLRWQLEGAVGQARVAVAGARRAGAPVGDLPALLARLERLAEAEDRTLAALAAGPVSGPAGAEAAARVRTAVDLAAAVRAAAVEALLVAGPEDLTILAGDIGTEVAALREGRRSG